MNDQIPAPGIARREPWAYAALAAIIAVFLLAASRHLDLPGLQADEACDPSYGMEVALGLAPSSTQWGFHALGRWWPLMSPTPYDLGGSFSIYVAALAFKLGGVGVASLRWSFLFVSAGVLAVLFALAREWFSTRVALVACALLAVDPVFYCWSRVGCWAIEWSVVLFGIGATLGGLLWLRRGDARYLTATAFVLGAGLNVSTKGLSYLIALPLLCAVSQPPRNRPRVRELTAAAAGFALGALSPLTYNLARGFPTAAVLMRSLAAPTAVGVDNAAFLSNLGVRLGQLLGDMTGRYPEELAGRTFPNLLAPSAFLAAVAVLAAASLRAETPRDRRPLAVLGLSALLLACTCFTPAALDPQHLIILWPWTALVVALAAERLWTARARWARPAVAAGLLALAFSQARADIRWQRALSETGGTDIWSDGIYALAGWLDAHGARRPLALCVGMTESVYLLTQGRVQPAEIHQNRRGPDAELLRRLDQSAREGMDLYLALATSYAPRWQQRYLTALDAAAARAGRRRSLEAGFGDRLGNPVFLVYRLEPARRQRSIKR